MNKHDFHIPFIKSLVIVAIITGFAMVSSHYVVEYYMGHLKFSNKNVTYASQESHK
jgi:hypothetical protein